MKSGVVCTDRPGGRDSEPTRHYASDGTAAGQDHQCHGGRRRRRDTRLYAGRLSDRRGEGPCAVLSRSLARGRVDRVLARGQEVLEACQLVDPASYLQSGMCRALFMLVIVAILAATDTLQSYSYSWHNVERSTSHAAIILKRRERPMPPKPSASIAGARCCS